MAVIEVPPVLNAAAIADLRAAVDRVAGEVVVFQGTPAVFCRGLDLDAPAGDLGEFAELLTAIGAGPPSIAAVSGIALGGGLGLAAACDLVLATPDSRFGLPELMYGMLPAIVTPVLRRRMSEHHVRLLGLRCETVSAEQALQQGLVDGIVADLSGETRRWTRVLSRAESVVAWKRYCAKPIDAVEITAAALRDPAVRERVRRFTEDGGAPWLG